VDFVRGSVFEGADAMTRINFEYLKEQMGGIK